MFQKVHIRSINLNTNFEFFRWKSGELLSFQSVLPSNLKFGFQLCADWMA